MSGCESAVEYVYQYIDDELTYTRRERIKWHLRRCGHCMSAFEFEELLKAKIAEAGKSEPPAELFDTLRALIEQERKTGDSGC
ncbi:MAG: zf-HC2 domain-containing protein [Actinomycetota bacterium]|nr:zf-HC2 domain-containing protein [Actinomycetota bacterium]